MTLRAGCAISKRRVLQRGTNCHPGTAPCIVRWRPLVVPSHDGLVMYLANILAIKYGRTTPLQGLGITWLAPVLSISIPWPKAGRLVLNLRGSLTTSDTSADDGIDNVG
ncbi:hypothetical protein BU17DRAFT_61067 [Hysterangium stoloniferum]|nr:hypothetical protein BU17DRAFT_61067 [Hysterangium stoloniferum]